MSDSDEQSAAANRPATAAGTGGRGADTDGTPTEEPRSVESLLADERSGPTAKCESCGDRHSVNDLQAVIGPHAASTVRLLCGRCADRTR